MRSGRGHDHTAQVSDGSATDDGDVGAQQALPVDAVGQPLVVRWVASHGCCELDLMLHLGCLQLHGELVLSLEHGPCFPSMLLLLTIICGSRQ